MERVVIVGAGLYGLIAAKTYLQIKGVYDTDEAADDATVYKEDIPSCFTEKRDRTEGDHEIPLLVIDSASDIGGTWAEERLYPNLLSQNSYGMYEFSDLPLTDVVPPDVDGPGKQFIAGWKINRYLHAWTEKWNLKGHIRLNWRVDNIQRLQNKAWELQISTSSGSLRQVSIRCDKLILATGLTSVPKFPHVDSPSTTNKAATVIHAKHVGEWARENLGYYPLPDSKHKKRSEELSSPQLRSVVIYGGAKSSFDLVHFFAGLHQHDAKVHLNTVQKEPIQVNWIIREGGTGPSWMAPPTSTLPNGEIVPSDKSASTRLPHHLNPFYPAIPKRIILHKSTGGWPWSLCIEGSWWARFIHGNPVGRWLVRRFWSSFDRDLATIAQYNDSPKMELLRPDHSVISCNSTIGIANQANLWETIRRPHVHVYRSAIKSVSVTDDGDEKGPTKGTRVVLSDGLCLDEIDLLVHATGYKPIVPIQFKPRSLRMRLGISEILDSEPAGGVESDKEDTRESTMAGINADIIRYIKYWELPDQKAKVKIEKALEGNGCDLTDCNVSSKLETSQVVPFRLFRRMVAPELVVEGDRSFAALGVICTSTIAVVAEVQALWIVAFLTGGLDDTKSRASDALRLRVLSRETMDQSIAEDVMLGIVSGSGLEAEAIHYNDVLMRDLGLNPYRLGGGRWRELTGVYEPSAYAGIVDEWREQTESPSRSK